MAAKPIERHIKRQIADQGGWDRILERIASGETVADIARSLRKPDGLPPSRNFISMLIHADPERSQRVKELQRTEMPDALVDAAVSLVDHAPVDRDGFNKARGQAEVRMRVAGLLNRERWGEKGQQVNVTVNQVDLHLDSLRHRSVEPLPMSSRSDRVQEVALHERETMQEVAVQNAIEAGNLQLPPPPKK